jgi:hypothetical protein
MIQIFFQFSDLYVPINCITATLSAPKVIIEMVNCQCKRGCSARIFDSAAVHVKIMKTLRNIKFLIIMKMILKIVICYYYINYLIY